MTGAPILVLGATGQVGRALPAALAAQPGTARLPVVVLGRAEADLARRESVRAIVRAQAPCAVINAAAYTAVDRAESEPELAHAVNAIAPAVLAEEAEALGACLVQYSTDYVFDGRKPVGEAYREDDPVAPLSVYGRTKLAGEEGARRCRRHLVLRTSWVAGREGTNFARTMLRLAAERESLRVVDDQHGAPTTAELIAEVTAVLLSVMLDAPADDERWGTYHLAARGHTTWHVYARRVIARAHAAGAPLRCRPEDVTPIATSEYPTPAARPANSRLETRKLRSTFPGVVLPPWEEDIDALVDQLIAVGTPR